MLLTYSLGCDSVLNAVGLDNALVFIFQTHLVKPVSVWAFLFSGSFPYSSLEDIEKKFIPGKVRCILVLVLVLAVLT